MLGDALLIIGAGCNGGRRTNMLSKIWSIFSALPTAEVCCFIASDVVILSPVSYSFRLEFPLPARSGGARIGIALVGRRVTRVGGAFVAVGAK